MESNVQYVNDRYEMPIGVSLCDFEAKLSVADVFTVFMDAAAFHAQKLGVGAKDMIDRGLFWLTVKTKVEILERPRLLDTVTVRTRPIYPEKVRSIREYRLERDGVLLARGKTEWAVMEIATGKIHRMSDVFPTELEMAPAPEFLEPFARINPDFSDAERLGTYRVRATDIDLGGHMNNAAYLKAVLGVLDTQTLKTMPQREIDVIFRAPCFEGEELSILRRKDAGSWDLAVQKADGSPALLIRAVSERL